MKTNGIPGIQSLIISRLHDAFDNKEAAHPIHVLNMWLAGRCRYISMRRMKEINCWLEQNSPRNTRYPSALAIYGGMHIPHEREEAIITLLEFFRCWPEYAWIVGNGEAVWQQFCAARSAGGRA